MLSNNCLLIINIFIFISNKNTNGEINNNNNNNADPQPPCSEAASSSSSCPELVCKLINSRVSDFCKDIECVGVTPEDCDNASSIYVPNLSMCGCCAGCVIYREIGEPCNSGTPPPPDEVVVPECTDNGVVCPIRKEECKPGLECHFLGENSKVCVDSTGSSIVPLSCEQKRNLHTLGQLHWQPQCDHDDDEDGSYSQKQCKGTPDDGFCFCAEAEEGKRIFGREWMSKSENQTCACSRHVHTLRNAKKGKLNYNAAIHCSYNGNYEPLQCDTDSGICYCVHPQTGKLTGAVLPEHKWKDLPCYSLNITGGGDPTGGYLRVCESEWVAGRKIGSEAHMHGLEVLSGKDLICDYDGSYGYKMRLQANDRCVTKMGNYNNAYYQLIDERHMNCQCFRDSLLYEEESRSFPGECQQGTGNYLLTGLVDKTPGRRMFMCLDEDGIPFGEKPVPELYQCCLVGDCSDALLKGACYDRNANPNGYRSCCSYPGIVCRDNQVVGLGYYNS